MSEPEIARRCAACGVSVRKSAAFCPQCGNPIVRYQTTDDVPTAATQALHTVPTADDESPSQVSKTAPTQVIHPSPGPTPTSAPASLHGVAENVRERVEKIRHVSHVVIDQAAYDPSLRFLLVAAVLFLLFIVLVIISKVLG
ncbi:MAG TPA: zinc ribbon domain-containing protein [Pyrinomonadaceae bacterium]|nr:zinc ribbon domain-containing protein [Pyrinomonadaceae bacterium]